MCRFLGKNNYEYTLSNSISTSESCLIVGNDNITIDCDGYTISGDIDSTLDYGIDNSDGFEGLKVKNCNIHQFGTGIHSKGNYGNFTNNNISRNSYLQTI